MKLTIQYKDKKLIYEIDKDITIKEILDNIISKLNIRENQKLLLFNKEKKCEINEILKIENEKFDLLLITEDNYSASKHTISNLLSINQLIMEVTGAKDKIIIEKVNDKSRPFSRRRYNDNIGLPFNYPPLNLSHYIFNPDLNVAYNDFMEVVEYERFSLPFIQRINIPVNEESVNRLIEMGFPETRVRIALRRHNNNSNRATEMLLTANEDEFNENNINQNNNSVIRNRTANISKIILN